MRHHRPYSRAARLLKAKVREALAPKPSDFEIERPIASGVHVSSIFVNRGRGADTPGRTTRKANS